MHRMLSFPLVLIVMVSSLLFGSLGRVPQPASAHWEM